MRQLPILVSVTMVLAWVPLFGAAGHAATIFDNGDAADSFISNPGNWDNGPPTAQQGTIAIDAQYDADVTHSGYDILHTDGDISRGNGFVSFALGTNTTWVMDGPTAAITQARGISLRDGSSFTLLNGNADLSDNNRDTTVWGAGASITVSGGTMTIGRNLIVRDGGVLTVNGGSISGIDKIFTQSFASPAGGFFFNGGSTAADTFELAKPGTATFGGTSAGALSLASLGTGVTLDWLSGSAMTLTIAGADSAYYEGLFAAGGLLFEGANNGAFSDHFQVSGETLSLVPEPASAAAAIVGLVFLTGRRRR